MSLKYGSQSFSNVCTAMTNDHHRNCSSLWLIETENKGLNKESDKRDIGQPISLATLATLC